MRIPFYNRRKTGGFTLVEMLITIGIMLFLFALVAVAAGRMREKARISKTKALLKRIAVALDAYHALNRNYPAVAAIGDPFPDTCPYSAMQPLTADLNFWRGVDMQKPFLIGSSMDDFNMDDLDPTGIFFVDAWGNRIKYRKVGPERCLVWSYGSKQGNNGVNPHPPPTSSQFNDDIGTGDYYDTGAKAWNNCGNVTRERDVYMDPTGLQYVGTNLTSHDTDF